LVPFKSGENGVDKISLIEFAPFWVAALRTISSRPVKNIMTFVSSYRFRVEFFERLLQAIVHTFSSTDSNIETEARRQLQFPQNCFLPTLGGIAASLLILRDAALFLPGSRNEALATR
jgi:hypothetical protein